MRGKNYRMPYAYPTEARMTALLDEVDRLRAGIGAALTRTTDRYAADDLVDLLNPTEGDQS